MKISACVITKNEEKNLATCLSSIQGIVSEIIVADTGSTDKTVEIAKTFGAKIYYYSWVNDFSKARNFAISKARGQWIIFLDADEYITGDSVAAVRQWIKTGNRQDADWVMCLLSNYEKTDKKLINMTRTIRIFKNHPCICYSGAIHETLTRTDRRARFVDASEAIRIIHTGYSRDEMREKNKATRNIELLLLEKEKNPKDSNIYFYLSESYMVDNDFRQALACAYKFIELNNGTLRGVYQKNYLNIILCMLRLNYQVEEIVLVIREALNKFPDFPDYHFHLGDCYRIMNRYHEAIKAYEAGLQHLQNAFSAESSACFSLKQVLLILGDLYYRVSQINKSITYFVETLKSDRYDYVALEKIIAIFSRTETHPEVVHFLEKIYDYSNVKDILYLLQASLKTNNSELAEFYFDKLTGEQKDSRKADLVQIGFIKGEYAKAAAEFEMLYTLSFENEYAIKFIVASVLAKNPKLLEHITDLMKPALKRIIAKILNSEKALSEWDTPEVLHILTEYIKLSQWDEVAGNLLATLPGADLFQVAEMALYYERYDQALEIYDQYLKSERRISPKTMAGTLLKMGECLYRQGNFDLALQFMLDAQKLTPQDYRIYEMAILICRANKDEQSLKNFTVLALQYYPDSEYLKETLKEVN